MNSSRSVWTDVVAAAAASREVEVLDAASSREAVNRFADVFISEPAKRWWWEHFRPDIETSVYHYGDADPWPAMLREIDPLARAVLVVTDEEPEPRGSVRGSVRGLVDLLGECPFFEYAIADADLRWAVFDTHHNDLVFARR